MINYEIYKIIHIASIFLMIWCSGVTLIANKKDKWIKILAGVSTLFIFISGMGLMARIGVGHGASWPTWIKVKIGLWLVLAILGPVFDKRLENKRDTASFIILILAVITASFAIFKFGA